MAHYWVETPVVDNYYQYEPPESGPIVECVEAQNKRDAKSVFVRQQYAEFKKHMMDQWNWFYHISGENPFTGLKATPCMCKHGVCNCDHFEDCTYGNPKDPTFDYCWDCIREDMDDEIRDAIAEAWPNRTDSDELLWST